jgi:hypothetical protein
MFSEITCAALEILGSWWTWAIIWGLVSESQRRMFARIGDVDSMEYESVCCCCNVFVLVHGDTIAVLYTFAAAAILAKGMRILHNRVGTDRYASISSRERPWHRLVLSSRHPALSLRRWQWRHARARNVGRGGPATSLAHAYLQRTIH